jgi:hypothetical protein
VAVETFLEESFWSGAHNVLDLSRDMAKDYGYEEISHNEVRQ